ncbi:MAG: glycosyltransferase family 2 protein [Propionibacteriaceae bacterium]|nr:glycosyltransferase family 2 protein [Propionibacteriaceae bacterium]
MKVAFCVVAWNNADVLRLCLDSLLAQTGVQADVYMIDNASTDETRAVMAEYPSVHVTWSKANTGFARGNNLMIAQALRDPQVGYVALVNTDATLDAAWASTLVGFAESRPNVGSLQGLTLDYFDHQIVDSTHIFLNPNLHAQQHGYGAARLPADQYYPQKVFGVNAAACMYTRAMIEALPDRQNGFFDERFFMYYEDIDVSYRALLCGWDAWFVPDALAYHMGSVSTKKRGSTYSLTMVGRNIPAVAVKNTPGPVLLRLVPNMAYGLAVLCRELLREQGARAALSLFTAYLGGLIRVPLYLGSRRRIMAAKVIDDAYLARLLRRSGVLG